MNTEPPNNLKEGAVPTIFSTIKNFSKGFLSENRITTQAKGRWKFTKFFVTMFVLTKMNQLQSTDTSVKCHTTSNVSKEFDWIILSWGNFMGGGIVLDTNILKNVYRFVLLEKSLNRENFCIISILGGFVFLELFHFNDDIICRTLYNLIGKNFCTY